MELKEKNKHPRDEHISFKEEGHEYNIDGDIGYTSVTSFLKQFFQEFDADKAIDNIRRSSKYRYSKYYGMDKRTIKAMWDNRREVAAKNGTMCHKDIENAYNYGNLEVCYPEFDQFLEFNYDHIKWGIYRTEWLIYNTKYRLAGSVDAIFQHTDTGKFIMCDHKTSDDIVVSGYNKAKSPISHLDDCNFWKYALQQNLYKWMLEEEYGILIDEMYITWFCKKNTSYKKIKVPLLSKEIIDILNSKEV